MEGLFFCVFNMSTAASPVILAVLLAGALLCRAPRKYSYLLWAVVGFRLVCPVSFRSGFSLFALVPAGMAPAGQGGRTSMLQYVPQAGPAKGAAAPLPAGPAPWLRRPRAG